MKFVAAQASLLATSVGAFAPAPFRVSNTALSMENEGGDNKDMSQALPFAPRPKLLDGSLAGDVGFDPFGFAGDNKESLLNMREAEIKHGRLAMLAVVGWPIAELFDRQLADDFGMPSLLTKSGESPSLLNGGLDKVDLTFWVALVSLSGIIEIENMKMKDEKAKNYQPGDCNFDPLGLFPEDRIGKLEMQTKEIKHGRIAMMAILGFVAQEALFGIPVVQETPFFFKPIFA
mmetsp:Transcript_26149/g.39575  ORF Transcript_26149/g.39575 Transcript_26149/m.39575 type:complete len:232 (+) Transcript_26149:140-835(+)|eukprot:CAMPEP_0178914140 /NCGR_PEP_ID=MMETSP0786-20121207/11250_1 /TAXON_ID=186022 /ORGANISM="Thalassionema frauenfeldii, Strain CCMP 1798" /LENGTH=231 /DNA_ID=CAMNT_0020586995 /DNA_START=76 /DNA_END=771 /DNA_ORIENTATION=+